MCVDADDEKMRGCGVWVVHARRPMPYITIFSKIEILHNENDIRFSRPIQILCYCKTIEIPDDDNKKGRRYHDTEHMDIAGIAVLYTNICWLVYHRRAQGIH